MLYEIMGWAGTLAILLAYLLVTVHKLDSASRPYQLLNVAGAAGLIINASVHGALPSLALNAVWLLIALVGLLRIPRQ